MLQLTRLSGPAFALNPDLIERAEETPDTVITLVNGSKYVIRESLEELIDLMRAYRADIVCASQRLTAVESAAPHVAAHRSARRDTATTGTVLTLHTGEE